MEIVVILSIVLIYLLLTINKGIAPEKIPGGIDDAVDLEKKIQPGKFIFSPDWHLVLKAKESMVGRLKGNSMKARGLCRNDLVIAKPVEDKLQYLKKGDLILVETSDEKNPGSVKLALREFDGELENGIIKTIVYNRFCPIKSAKHHKKDIVAVVEKIIKQEQLLRNPLAVN
ncbi:MAG TPA: hypothetical protein PKH02_03980 [Bacteroidales bacterium]|nr:hypothetical protein [Bacteroidales bacterium]HPT11587.1 hypothetical protein [Bacteroidales bacterium]